LNRGCGQAALRDQSVWAPGLVPRPPAGALYVHDESTQSNASIWHQSSRPPAPQAWCLDPVLLSKTKAWAAASGGCFPAWDRPGFVRYESGREGDEPTRIRWANIKSVDRAVEKSVRVYSQVPLCLFFHRGLLVHSPRTYFTFFRFQLFIKQYSRYYASCLCK
jgi:hypothetical protein